MTLKFMVGAACYLILMGSSAAAQAPAMRGTVDLRIGEGDQPDGPYLFESIRGLLLDSQGRILVAEGGSDQLRIFGSDGRHLYSYGRAGAGPGDLRQACCLAFDGGGKLWVREDGNRRYSILAIGPAKATFERSVPTATPSPRDFGRVSWDPQGRVVDISGARTAGNPVHAYVRSFIDSRTGVRGADTVAPPPKDSLDFHEVAIEGGVATYYAPYGASQLRAFGPGGDYAAAVNTRYAVTWFDTHGKPVTVLTRSLSGPPLSAAERKATEERNAAISARVGKPIPFKVPARKPVLSQLGFDLDGRLWIRRSSADGAAAQADVFLRSGKQVATMTWPANIDLMAWSVRGTTALGVERDDDGVERVVRLTFK